MDVRSDERSTVPVTSKQPWFRAATFAFIAIALIHACGGGSGGPGPVPACTVTAISISPSELTPEAQGATSQLEARARDPSGNVKAAPFSWSSSDITVVTVDADGLFTT